MKDPALLPPCPDCGVPPGHFHAPGCDVERCRLCGGQRISCGCYEADDFHDRVAALGGPLPWTGVWPGVEECEEFGWLRPDGREDLNRLYSGQAVWDAALGRFVLAPPRVPR